MHIRMLLHSLHFDLLPFSAAWGFAVGLTTYLDSVLQLQRKLSTTSHPCV